ncbi:MAG TPA: hypothetical protein VE011_10360 [Candidatus Dormibacteraeota bacterium]|nr:hypothetical protein [Candidatus Dormibacteraeota bacterium]
MIPRRTAFPAPQVLIVLAIAAVAIGCNGTLPFGSAGNVSATQAADRIHQQANDALQRWADAVRKSGGATISFVGDLTGQIGDWEAPIAGNAKLALAAGLVTAPTPLSDETPSREKVSWVGGSSIDVDVLSAAAALANLVADGAGGCADCTPLVVTDANLATSLIETSVGPAQAPVWVFTLKGTAVRATRVAVDPSVTVEPPPYNADNPPVGVSIDHAVGKSDSRKLTVSFVGAVKGGDQPCGADYTAEAVESDLAVVVIIEEHLNPAASGSCDLVGHTRTASLTLNQPLGKRAVLEVRQGLPVPVSPS